MMPFTLPRSPDAHHMPMQIRSDRAVRCCVRIACVKQKHTLQVNAG